MRNIKGRKIKKLQMKQEEKDQRTQCTIPFSFKFHSKKITSIIYEIQDTKSKTKNF